MTFQELKINLAEWLLLKVKYPSEYVMGTPGLRRFEQYKGKKKIILTLIPSHDNLGDHAIALHVVHLSSQNVNIPTFKPSHTARRTILFSAIFAARSAHPPSAGSCRSLLSAIGEVRESHFESAAFLQKLSGV